MRKIKVNGTWCSKEYFESKFKKQTAIFEILGVLSEILEVQETTDKLAPGAYRTVTDYGAVEFTIDEDYDVIFENIE